MTATESDPPHQVARMNVNVNLQDQNDNTPKFTKDIYTKSVSGEQTVGMLLVQVRVQYPICAVVNIVKWNYLVFVLVTNLFLYVMILFKGESRRPRCRSKWRDHILPRLWKQRGILLYQYEQWRDNSEENFSIRGYDFGILVTHNSQRWYTQKITIKILLSYLLSLSNNVNHNDQP